MDSENYYDRLNTNRDEEKVVILKNVTFAWDKTRKHVKPAPTKKSKEKKRRKSRELRGNIQRNESTSSGEIGSPEEQFMLRDFSLEIGREEFVGVAGNVGSGKTSLLLALIGEMQKKEGDIQIPENLNSK